MGTYKVKSEVVLYPGLTGWHFIPIPKKISQNISKKFGKIKRGWGSLPVLVTLGKITWKTSIFPDKKAGAYLLPLKKEIRKKEHIYEKDIVKLTLQVII